MIKKSLLALVALSLFMCGSTYGQFVPIRPSDVGQASGGGAVNQLFDISARFDQAPNTTTLRVANGFVSPTTDSWTVSEGEQTTFILGGSGAADAFVNHGANLGSEAFQNGSLARDGFSAATGETWTLTSAIDSTRYTPRILGSDYVVDYTGPESNQREANPVGFRWQSDEAVTSFTVFSSNTTDLNNNYNVGFRAVAAVPEPSAGLILAFAGLAALRRKRS